MSTRGQLRTLPGALRMARRDLRGWTQKELAARASEVGRRHTSDIGTNVSAALIAMVETGERQFSIEVAEWVAEALGVEVAAFAVSSELAV
ncbi:MAG: helix-turn-helix domain-containing protein [Acidimicrobiales bacterium]